MTDGFRTGFGRIVGQVCDLQAIENKQFRTGRTGSDRFLPQPSLRARHKRNGENLSKPVQMRPNRPGRYPDLWKGARAWIDFGGVK